MADYRPSNVSLSFEHLAPARHTALCRDAARFALFVGSSPACPLELHTRPVVMAPPMQRPLSASAFSSIVPPGVQYGLGRDEALFGLGRD